MKNADAYEAAVSGPHRSGFLHIWNWILKFFFLFHVAQYTNSGNSWQRERGGRREKARGEGKRETWRDSDRQGDRESEK